MSISGDVSGRILDGMVVRSADGEKLGKVLSAGQDEFYIEKGLFFPKDYVVSFADVQEIRGDEIILRTGRESLERVDESLAMSAELPIGGYAAQTSSTDLGKGNDDRYRDQQEGRITLSEEQLQVSKHQRQAGAVRVSKEVIEETRTIEVPVRKEQVRVEKVPASAATASAKPFEDQGEVVIPVHEEEIEVHKRPVVTGEVRVSRESYQEEQRVADTVRHEEARVESEGNVSVEERSAPGSDRDKKY